MQPPTPEELLHQLTNDALNHCTEKQQAVYRLAHGITPNGFTNEQRPADIARTLNIARQSVHDILTAAQLRVYRHIALTLTKQLCTIHIQNRIPIPGPNIPTYEDTPKEWTQRTEQTINLGPQSQAAISTEKSRIRNQRKTKP